MKHAKPYDDATLIAYLDGQLGADAVAEIDTALEGDQVLGERIKTLDVDVSELTNAFGELTNMAPTFPLQSSNPPARLPLWKMAIAACALIASGLTGAYFATQDRDDWVDIAAAYHLLYVNQTLAHIDRPEAIVAAELKRISAPLSISIARQDIDIEGLTYKRGQILGFNQIPLIHLSYLTENGTPVAFCILNKGAQPTQDTVSSKLRGLNSERWSDGRFEYLLIGDVETRTLKGMASDIAARLAATL